MITATGTVCKLELGGFSLNSDDSGYERMLCDEVLPRARVVRIPQRHPQR